MRHLLLLILFAASLSAAEPPTTYPLWDNQESVSDYAKRVNLPPTKTLDLGDNVKLELVLIPAGKFIMGTPPPTPVDEAGFNTKIVTAQVCLAASGGALLILLGFVLVPAIRKRRRPQLSLGLLLMVTVATGGCVLSGLHWQKSADGLQAARLEYAAAKIRFKDASEFEKPAHAVTLTQPFYMGKFDVTQEQYQMVTGTNPSRSIGKNQPVGHVSWDDTQEFCKLLTARTTQTVRLPTEAEWEYGCRAGTATAYHSGDTQADLDRVGWHLYNNNYSTSAYPVGQKEANAFGLYDMHGNIWQRCQDWYGKEYYRNSPAENPQGPISVSDDFGLHVLRGGSYSDFPLSCTSAHRRLWSDPPLSNFGFRVVLPVDLPRWVSALNKPKS